MGCFSYLAIFLVLIQVSKINCNCPGKQYKLAHVSHSSKRTEETQTQHHVQVQVHQLPPQYFKISQPSVQQVTNFDCQQPIQVQQFQQQPQMMQIQQQPQVVQFNQQPQVIQFQQQPQVMQFQQQPQMMQTQQQQLTQNQQQQMMQQLAQQFSSKMPQSFTSTHFQQETEHECEHKQQMHKCF